MTAKARGDDPAATAAEVPAGDAPPRRSTVILAADVAGYSRLLADDEAGTLRRLMTFRTELHETARRFGGRVFSTAGDTLLAEFRDPVKALQGAMAAQASLERRNQALPANRQMRFRMGLASGIVLDRDGDLSGDGVNVALRLESLAGAGGICLSRPVQDAIAGKVEVELSDIGPQTVRNSQARVHAMMVVMPPVGRLLPVRGPWPAPSGRQLLLAAGILALALLAAVAWRRLDADQPVVSIPKPAITNRAAEEAAERIARDRAEAERIARDKAEAERIARDKAEAERIAHDRAEAERIARDRAEAERIARDKAEAERIARDRAEAETERIARDRAGSERFARERAEAARLAREKLDTDRNAQRGTRRPAVTKAQCAELNERGILGELTPEDRAALQRGDCR